MPYILFFTSLFMIFGVCAIAAGYAESFAQVDPEWAYIGFCCLVIILILLRRIVAAGGISSYLKYHFDDDFYGQDVQDAKIKEAKSRYPLERKLTRSGAFMVYGSIIPIWIAPNTLDRILFGPIPLWGLLVQFLIGSGMAWICWSIMITVWRRRCRNRGADEKIIQRFGEHAGLLWPKTHNFL